MRWPDTRRKNTATRNSNSNYTQTTGEGNDYGAIIWSFENSVTNLPWNSGGVMIAFENGKATLYARGDAGLIAKTTSGLTLDNGKTYDISLSVCQIAANQLRVIVKVDGAEGSMRSTPTPSWRILRATSALAASTPRL